MSAIISPFEFLSFISFLTVGQKKNLPITVCYTRKRSHGRRNKFRGCPCTRGHQSRMTKQFTRAYMLLGGRVTVPRSRNFSPFRPLFFLEMAILARSLFDLQFSDE